MEVNETKAFVKQVTNDLEKYLLNLCDKSEKKQKKAELITYWIRDYKNYLDFEEVFTPKKLKNYERGDVVKVNFGFNIGNEEGGLHYAVVVDNCSTQTTGVVTVIPLSSIKAEEEDSKYTILIGNDLYCIMENKYNSCINTYNESINRLSIELDKYQIERLEYTKSFEELKSSGEYTFEKINDIEEKQARIKSNIDRLILEVNECKKKKTYIKKIKKEFDKMKSGSKALVGQITTVSKMRIFNPRHDDDILANVKLSPTQLDKISEKIKELYIYGIDKSYPYEYNVISKENSAV